jgi:arsenite transporter
MTAPSSPLGFFERYLSLWIAFCISAGIGLGIAKPSIFQTIADLEYASINLVVAIFESL